MQGGSRLIHQDKTERQYIVAEASGNPTSSDPLYARAVSLASKGYHVFPAHVVRHPDGTKDVRTPDWRTASTTDLDALRAWFADGHTWTDVCIDCGKSGIVVVDLDVRESGSGIVVWDRLQNEHGWAGGRKKDTPSGGTHLYFRNDPRQVIGSRNGAWEHVDVKGAGGMVFAYGYVPKPYDLPLRPAWLAERVKVVGGSGSPDRVSAASTSAQSAAGIGPDPDGFSVPGQVRAFTKAQAEAFCAGAWAALVEAPRGTINERLNIAAATFSHFVPSFWSEADVTAWLIEGQRQAWVASGGADDGNYDAATATIRSGLAQTGDPWRAVKAADAPAAFGGRPEADAPVPTGADLDAAVSEMLGRFLDLDGLASLPPLEPLVKGVLYRRTLATVTGAYASLKTFVALDLALSVATGTPWHGRNVRQGKVWYLLAEGVSGLRDRVAAWRDEWARVHEGDETQLEGLENFRVLPAAVQVKESAWDVLVAAAAVEKPDLIVVDTKARHTAGYEENSASDTAVVVARIDALKEAAGGTVLVVHHTGWSGDRMRGSSAWGGALDTDILVTKTGDRLAPKAELRCEKQKDGPEFEPFTLQARSVELGMDVDGQLVTSLAFEAGDVGFTLPGPADEQITGALDVHEEQHPEALVDLVAVMESIAPAGSALGRTQAEVRALMELGKAVHPEVRRVARRGKHAGQRGYSKPEIHRAFVLAAAYGWLEPGETPAKFTIASATERERRLEDWRAREAASRVSVESDILD